MLTCVDRCTSGAIECSPSGGLETCELTSNGCTDWLASACPTGETCGDGGQQSGGDGDSDEQD